MKILLLNTLLNILLPLLLNTIGSVSEKRSRKLASFMAKCAFNCFFMKRLIRCNLKVAFPQKSHQEIDNLVKTNLFHTFWNWIDFLRMLKRPEEIEERINSVEMPDNLQFPVMICLPHLGNWEVLAQAIPLYLKGRCAAVATLFKYSKLNELLSNSRTRSGLEIIPREGAVRGVFRALHDNCNVGVLIDQNLNPRRGGIFVDFFGLPAPTSPLPAIVYHRNPIQLLNATCIREENGNFKVILQEITGLTKESSLQEITQRIISANEGLIHRWPEQYTWLYKRWTLIPTDLEPERAAKLPAYAKQTKYAINAK